MLFRQLELELGRLLVLSARQLGLYLARLLALSGRAVEAFYKFHWLKWNFCP